MSFKYDYMDEMIELYKDSRETHNDLYHTNPFYNKIKVPIYINVKNREVKKSKPLYYYHSVKYIRHAITGMTLNEKVGSKSELNYFKVKNLDPSRSVPTTREYPLFFDSPEEFENHFDCSLDKKIKEAYHLKMKF